jgi:probable LLM family oxidoreductase
MTDLLESKEQGRAEQPGPKAQGAAMQIGVDSFAAMSADSNVSAADSIRNLVHRIELADHVGLDVFGVGEHHRKEYLDSAPQMILAAAATQTKNIRLSSAVTVLSAADPVRVFQNFATLDLLSQGRAEIVAGRGSFTEAFPLFGLQLEDYDSLYAEKLDLLLKLRDNEFITWSGEHRPALTGQGVYPRPLQNPLPIWVGIGGTPESAARAGVLGLPLMIAIIGGETRRFRPIVDIYREFGRRAGHAPEKLKVGVHAVGYVAETTQQAIDDFFPGYAKTFTRIGRERGWPPVTRAQFDALRSTHGAFMVGNPGEVAEKILRHSEALGGLSRLTFQMDVAELAQPNFLRGIELLGTHVASIVRKNTGKPPAT